MDTGFQDVVKRVITGYGLEILDDKNTCKDLLADYAKGKYKPERRLFLLALERGCHTKIAQASKPELIQSQMIRTLQDDYLIAPQAAEEVILLLRMLLPAPAQPPGNHQAAPSPQPIPAGLEFEIVDGSGVTITRYTGSAAEMLIPDRIQDLPVRSVGDYAFCRCDSLTNVVIPSSVTAIEYRAFAGCGSLANVVIPSSVTAIEDKVFCECRSLANVVIPSSVTAIGDGAFSGCSSLTKVDIPPSVKDIGDGAFAGCGSLTGIVIPPSVTIIRFRAFAGCGSLTKVDIPSSVTVIEKGAFTGCGRLANADISSSVKNIGDWAFYGCGNLESVTLSRWTKLGRKAFPGGTKLNYR
ncbi:MAG: leucine-rich repeat domain-containing protein [Treponema sp.]|jgi:hypothetical protein|nr:leucine-rich repeat domain-containing protein [Treponema sp.]